MVIESNIKGPFGLVVTGEAEQLQPALDRIIGPRWLRTYAVAGPGELLEVVGQGLADAAVLDSHSGWGLDVLQLLRTIRRLDSTLPVVILTVRQDRRWMESALRLAAFSVVIKPLELEEMLRQIYRMMARLDRMLRD